MTIQEKRDTLKRAVELLKETESRDMRLDEIIPTMGQIDTLKSIVDYWTNEIARTGEREYDQKESSDSNS